MAMQRVPRGVGNFTDMARKGTGRSRQGHAQLFMQIYLVNNKDLHVTRIIEICD